jgi:SAM-dependent methyltransferase
LTHKKTTPKYLKPYQDAVEQFGATFDATLWRSRESQMLRFKTFCNFVDFGNMSILDVGCGIGDFAHYLIESGVSFSRFHGIDAIQEMIESARNRDMHNCTFETVDVVTDHESMQGYDWLTFSGTLNAMEQGNAIELIEAAFSACTCGVAFNFLSNQSGRSPSDEDLHPATRFDTPALLSHAFSLTPLVDFTQTYLTGHDATIILRKQELPQ